MEYRSPDTRSARSADGGLARTFCGPRPAGRAVSARRAIARLLFALAALPCSGIAPALAAPPPHLAWACWISEQEPISIKCIRDRSHLIQNVSDNPEAALMNLRPDPTDILADAPAPFPPATYDWKNQADEIVPDDPDNDLETGVLDQIYSKILAGDTARLDDFVERHSDDLRKDSVWAIKIHSLPLDSSWRENRPARIVKSALCRGIPSCRVILREPGL